MKFTNNLLYCIQAVTQLGMKIVDLRLESLVMGHHVHLNMLTLAG